MLKKFKKVEKNKAELDIQSIEVTPQQPGSKPGEKIAAGKEPKVSSIPGKD